MSDRKTKVPQEWLDAVESFVTDYLGYINSDDYDLPDVTGLIDLLKAEGIEIEDEEDE